MMQTHYYTTHNQQLSRWRLSDATLYVTLEPCIMCAGALLQSRVGTLVYGASNPLLGADGSYVDLLRPPPEQGQQPPSDPCGEASRGGPIVPRAAHPFHPDIMVRRGVLADACGDVLRQFFRRRRMESNAVGHAQWNE